MLLNKGKQGLFNNKQISINLVANIVSFSSNIIVSFVLTPFLINVLGKEIYGFYPIAITIVSYFSVLTNALNAMASRFVTVALVQNNKEEGNKFFSSTLAADVILGGIILVPMILIVLFLERFMDIPFDSRGTIKSLFALVFLSTLLNVLASFLGIATFAKNRIDLRSLREFVTAVLKIALFFILYKYLKPSILYVGLVAVTVSLVNIMFQATYTKILLPEISIKLKYISRFHTKELIGSSCWNAISTFGNILLAGMSLVLANMFYGATASGTYSIVHTVPQFICGIIIMLTGVFFPVITYKYAQKNKDDLINTVKSAQNIIGLISCVAISVFSALATEFFALWTPGEDAIYLSKLSFFTIMPHYIIACTWSLTNLNVAMNKVKIPAIFTLASGVANILIAFAGYYLLKISLISLPIISSALQIIWVGIFIPQYACHCLNVKWSTFYSPLVKALLCSVVIFLSVAYVKQLFTLNSWGRLILFGGCTASLAFLVILLVHAKYLLKIKSMFSKNEENI